LPLSAAVTPALEGGSWALVIESRETAVWRVTFSDGRLPVYAKAAVGRAPGPDAAVAAEHDRLVWLAEHHAEDLPLPTVLAYEPGDDAFPALLVTAALPGEPDLRLLPDVDTAVGLLGRTLAALHALDPAGFPFDAGPDARLAEVATRLRSGQVDFAELPPGYHRIAPDRLIELLESMHPGPVPAADRVLLHGDLCVTNLLFDPASANATGLVDWRWSGVGDRHQDLAVTAASVVRNFGAEVLPRLFEAYGLVHPDARRLEFYGVLEELS
jgi:aminoglycoside phosphotransferase